MNWFTKYFEKAEWRLCGTVEVPITHTHHITDVKTSGKLYYYLYENQHGTRRFDVADTIRGDTDMKDIGTTDFAYRCEDYLTKVKPWMDGRKIKGIAAYDKVKHHEMVQSLKEGD
jgi:hypothetical protein